MSDPRLARLAHLLTHHCIALEGGDRVLVEAPFVAEPLTLALVAEILEAGANPHVLAYPDRYWGVYLRHAKEPQLAFTPTFEMFAYTTFEARVLVYASVNTRSGSRADPRANSLVDEAWAPIVKAQFEREAAGRFKRVTTMYPTHAYAQDTRMGIEEFEELVYRACHVNEPGDDPVAYWTQMSRDNDARSLLLEGHRKARLRSADCDLEFSLEGRRFLSAGG